MTRYLWATHTILFAHKVVFMNFAKVTLVVKIEKPRLVRALRVLVLEGVKISGYYFNNQDIKIELQPTHIWVCKNS